MTLLLLVYSLCINISHKCKCVFSSLLFLSRRFLSSVFCLKFKFFFSSDFFCSKKLSFLKERTRERIPLILIESFLSLCLSLSSLLSSSVVCSAVLLLVFCRCSFFKRKDALFLLRSLVNDGVGGIQRER